MYNADHDLCAICDGEYVTNEQMNDKKFLKLVSR